MSALDVNPAKRRRSGATSGFVGFTDDVDSGAYSLEFTQRSTSTAPMKCRVSFLPGIPWGCGPQASEIQS